MYPLSNSSTGTSPSSPSTTNSLSTSPQTTTSSSTASSILPQAKETPQEAQARIARQLEKSILDDCEAVNTRNWNPATSPLFRNKSPSWAAYTTATLSLQTLTVQDFVDKLKLKTTASPNFRLRPIDFSTTVDLVQGRAEIFANMEVSGDWDGVAQRNVTICEYECVDGEWLHASHRTMPGMDPNMMLGG